MFGGIANWLKKRVDDVQGAFGVSNTAQTYRTNVPKPAPAQTVSRPPVQNVVRQPSQQNVLQSNPIQQPKFNLNQSLQTNGVTQPKSTGQLVNESYGKGLSSVLNRAKDVVDANTAADKIKRQATSGLSENYNQEQDRKTNAVLANPSTRNTANQFAASGLREVVNFGAKAPGAVMNLGGSIMQSKNPVVKTLRSAVPVLNAAGNADSRLGGEGGKLIQRQGQNLNKFVDNKVTQSPIGERKNENKWAVGAGSLTTQLPMQIATGGLGLVNTGLQTASDEYNAARKAGKTNDQSLGIGTLQGGASALSEKFGIDRFIPGKGNTGSLLTKAAKSFITEGGQEAQQQFTQNLIANKTYNPSQSLKQGVGESFILGGLAGSGTSFASDAFNRPSRPSAELSTPQATKLRPDEARSLSDLQDVLNNRVPSPSAQSAIIQQARQAGLRNNIDVTTGSPADIQTRINTLLEQPKNSKPFWKPTPLNDGGYIQTPDAGSVKDAFRDILPSRTRPASIKEIVNQGGSPLYHDTSAKGVIGILDSGEISARQAPFSQIAGQGKRVSTTRNFDNYSRYGKSPYRLVVDERATGQKSIPDNRDEFESVFNKSIPSKSIKSIAIDTTNPAILSDIDNGVLDSVIAKAQEKGIRVELFEGKILPNEGANVEIQDLTKSRFSALKDKLGIKPLNEVGAIGEDVRPDAPARGNFQEQVLTPKPIPKTLNEFDRMIGGTGNIESEVQSPALRTQEMPKLSARTGGNAEPSTTIPDVLSKYSDSPALTDIELSKGKNARRGLIRKTTGFVGEKLSATGDGTIQRKIRRAEQYIFGKQTGQNKEIISAMQRYQGDSTYTDAALLDIGKKAYSLLPDTASRERVHSVLDPETAKAGASVSETNLAPNELQAVQMLRDIGESINDTSYRMGMISKKKWLENKDGRYIARMYREIENAPDVANLLDLPDTKRLFTGMYKSREEFNDYLRERILRDPVKLAVIRARQVRSNEVLDNYYRQADQLGYVSDIAKKGYVKVQNDTGLRSWNGRYVRQDVYENVNGFKSMSQALNGMNTVLDAYDGNPARKLRKRLLTIWNPVVRTGNVTSNYFFAYLNGVNPATYQKNKLWAKKVLKKGSDPLYTEAQKAGLIGNNLIASDRNLFNKDKDFMAGLDREAINNTSALKRAGQKTVELKDRVTKRYGEADDVAKLSAFKTHVDRGMSVNEAIEKTRKGFQDYNRVGHLYDLAAKSPVFGNAFVRFQGDLYMNIMKNAAIDHPLRVASIPAATLLLGNALSAASGESAEDKETRENRLGAPKIPFTNISTEFQTPVGAVDVSRFTPLYMRNILSDSEGGKNKLADDLSRLLPFNIPGSNTKSEWARAAASDPLIGPIISTITDTDWRGKSVKDPEGFRDGKELFPDNKLSKSEELRNRLQYGVRSYAPYPFNEVGDIFASMNQNMRTEQSKRGGKDDPRIADQRDIFGRTGFNTSGSKKSLAQSIARLGGIRAQEYNKEDAAKERENKKMFAFFDDVDNFKNTLDSMTKNAFDARHKSSRTRDGIKQEFESDPWYKYKNASELLQNQALFEAEKQYATMQNKYDGKPIDPVFDLPPDQRNMVLAKKLKLPGSKDEGFNSLYDQEWYQNFRATQDEYYANKSAYAKSKGWSDYESDNPYPEASADVQKAMNYYFSLPSGTGQRSDFIKNNPKVWNSITDQWASQDAWTDKERQKLGLPQIARDDKYSKYNSNGGGKGKGKGQIKKYKSISSNDISKKLQQLAKVRSSSSKSSTSPRKHTAKLKGVRSA